MLKETVHDKIEDLSNRLNCSLTTTKGKFNLTFNIRNLDFVRYVLELDKEDFEFQGNCEMLAGTSDKPSYFSGNTSVQNRFSITCKYKNHDNLPEFSIYESGLLSRLVCKKHLTIKRINSEFIKHLKNRKEVNFLEERVKNTGEISPAINCKKIDGLKELTIYFQSFSIELDLFEKMIELSQNLETAYNDVHVDQAL